MPRDLNYYRGRFHRAMNRDEERGRELEEEGTSRLRNFDANEAARRASEAQSKDFFEELGRNVEDLRGSQARRGRLDTGFAFEDEDELVSEAAEDFGDSVAARSMQAARMNLGASQSLMGAGERATGRYLDILAGERDTELMQENLRRRRDDRRRRGIFSLLGGGAGFLLGGPAGGKAGAAIGAGAGDIFG